MRIAIDALLLRDRFSGTEVYIYNLIKEIQRLDSQNTYFIFVNDKLKLDNDLLAKDNFIFRVIRNTSQPLRRVLYEQTALTRELTRFKIDVFHSLDFILPLRCPVKSVITVHDLIFKICPETILSYKRLYYNLFVRNSLNKASKIIAVSKNTKQDLIRLFAIPEEKIKVIYHGLDICYRPLDKNLARSKILEIYGLDGDFLLYAGRIESRKNLGRLIKAYCRIKKEDNIKHKLVIAGPPGRLNRDTLDLLRKPEFKSEIVFLGQAASEQLLYLYNASSLFIYPSLYEGFGLPVIEAMACRVPVITSDNSSLREIAGDSALLVDPYDIEKIIGAIRILLKNDYLRSNLIDRGLAKIREFSWEKAAQEAIFLYKEAAAQSDFRG
ncbi:MAG: hypothetical protein A3K83_01075 [Omnitrophica WOR_2 bacterium RBG_13_44_8b]|nr:MAG: hypothetical protein A3K83_01075 [Omnitrophica WOR_2 bacterium RBG_13_44_8b]